MAHRLATIHERDQPIINNIRTSQRACHCVSDAHKNAQDVGPHDFHWSRLVGISMWECFRRIV